MMKRFFGLTFFASTLLLLSFALAGCGESDALVQKSAQKEPLLVYKSPTCGCCEAWMDHMSEAGFEVTHEHPENMLAIKENLQIAPQYGSCHTGVSEAGYVFEGHVPAKAVQRFLAAPPKDSIGLAVPRMPMGSPGMEMEDHFEAYDVLLLKTDGSSEVYMHIANQEEQY